MKNIELISSSCFDVHSSDVKIGCVDSLNEVVYFIKNYEEVVKLNCKSGQVTSCLKLSEKSFFMRCSFCPRIVSLACFTDQDSLCIIVDGGDLLMFNYSENEIDDVGYFEDGICAASWSPDGNNLVIITCDDDVVLMNRDFNIRKDHNYLLMDPEYLSTKDEVVSVGWGKKETQFHGSEGKDAASKKDVKKLKKLDWDDWSIRISWQGDGQMFAVSCLNRLNFEEYRQIRIYSCDGDLKAVSEPLEGLEMAIDWKPSGSLIAAVQRTPTKYQVIFLERNGLEHGDFFLPYEQDEVVVQQLLWNADSSLLAVRVKSLPKKFKKSSDEEKQEISEILIWSRGNYHWYLKQTLKPKKAERFVECMWHPEKPKTLLYLTSSGCYRECSWDWTIHRSHGFTKCNKSYVAVIDGDTVLVTPFRDTIVPPPNARYTCKLPSFVNSVVFPSYAEENKLAALLADDRVAIISIDDDKMNISQILSLKWDDSIEHQFGHFLHHWTWIKPNLLTAVYSKNSASFFSSILIEQETATVKIDSSYQSSSVVGTCVTSCGKDLIHLLSNGSLMLHSQALSTSDHAEESNMEFSHHKVSNTKFPQQCHQIDSCHVSGQHLIFGLTKHFQLYCGNMELMRNCSSFALHDKFLVTTTLDHTLHCIPLVSCKEMVAQKQTALMEKADNVRNIERGSVIVTCVPEDTKVILQMPRGNLECIHPRALVVTMIAEYLDKLMFYDAFSLMRRHRINLNLLFDHNPQLFLTQIEKFVTDVDNVNWLNVFLSDLSGDNIVATLYSQIYNVVKCQQITTTFPNKVNVVCEKMRQALEKIDSKKYLLVILSTYALMKPPALEDALNLINGLKGTENDENTIESALTFMTYLIDVNELFNIAVGTYDFDLVIMVAQKTQKDPKEYLPFLNELKSLDEYYKRFRIDCHLKRPIKALENVVKAGDSYFDQCLVHIKSFSLYRNALSLYRTDSVQYKTVCAAYGDYLKGKYSYNEAGIFYCRAGCTDKALEVYEKNVNWHQAMVLAVTHLETSKVVQLASSFAQKLKQRNQYRDAAYLLEIYVKNTDESIFTLIEGHEWLHALEMIHRYGRTELIDSRLLPTLKEYSLSFHKTVENMKILFLHHVDRLMVVRTNKLNAHLEQGEECIDDSASDITSITESSCRTYASSATSRMTGRTSRNRRKEERKKHSLKEGSFYEDRALMEALNEIATNADKIKEECSGLIEMLLTNGFDEEASLAQNSFSDLSTVIKENFHKIWLEPLENLQVQNNMNAEQPNGESTRSQFSKEEFKYMLPPQIRSIKWEADVLKPGECKRP